MFKTIQLALNCKDDTNFEYHQRLSQLIVDDQLYLLAFYLEIVVIKFTFIGGNKWLGWNGFTFAKKKK